MTEYKGVIKGYRRGPNAQYPNQVLVEVLGVDREKARQLIGSKVEYIDRYGNKYEGVIIRHHGTKNTVRVKFNPNIPGQAIGDEVTIKPIKENN